MATYIILSKFSAQAFTDPKDLIGLTDTVAAKIKSECPKLSWRGSYATMGRFDAIDVVESEDHHQVEKAAMIIRAYGRSTTETLPATPWKDFIASL
jgi:uncharacterized protein with GYD domain